MSDRDAIKKSGKSAWFKRPILLLLSVVALLFGLLLFCGYLWFHSTRDLDGVREYARTQGVATSYEELIGPNAGNADAVAMLQKLTDLTERLIAFDESAYAKGLDEARKVPSFGGENLFYPGMTVAPELRHYYNYVHDQALIAEIIELMHQIAVYEGQYLRVEDLENQNQNLTGAHERAIFFVNTRWRQNRRRSLIYGFST